MEGVSLPIQGYTIPIKPSTATSTPKVDGAPESTCVRGTTNNATSAAETSYEVMAIGQVCPSPRSGLVIGYTLFQPTVGLGERWFGVRWSRSFR